MDKKIHDKWSTGAGREFTGERFKQTEEEFRAKFDEWWDRRRDLSRKMFSDENWDKPITDDNRQEALMLIGEGYVLAVAAKTRFGSDSEDCCGYDNILEEMNIVERDALLSRKLDPITEEYNQYWSDLLTWIFRDSGDDAKDGLDSKVEYKP